MEKMLLLLLRASCGGCCYSHHHQLLGRPLSLQVIATSCCFGKKKGSVHEGGTVIGTVKKTHTK